MSKAESRELLSKKKKKNHIFCFRTHNGIPSNTVLAEPTTAGASEYLSTNPRAHHPTNTEADANDNNNVNVNSNNNIDDNDVITGDRAEAVIVYTDDQGEPCVAIREYPL